MAEQLLNRPKVCAFLQHVRPECVSKGVRVNVGREPFGDGDPLDALLLAYESAVPGSVQLARPIGVLDMMDDKGPDAKVLMVPARDARFDGVGRLADLPDHWKLEITAFFNTYKMLDGGNPEIKGWRGPAAAWKEIKSAQRAFSSKKKKKSR